MEFSYLLNIVMISRLIYGVKDTAVTGQKTAIVIIIQFIMFLVFKPSAALILLLTSVIVLNLSVYYLERRLKNLNLFRLVTIIIFLIIISIFTSQSVNISFNENVPAIFNNLKNYSSLLADILKFNVFNLSLILTGTLLVLNESNFAIRYFFELFNLMPQVKNKESKNEIDCKEYNAGRIIGMLERVLIFYFLISNQYTAIGLVVAAKGFTRFKELNNRLFAEYVLIGTFLSAIFAFIIAETIKLLLY